MKVSLIIATYNNKDVLRLSLESAFDQTRMLDEIVVADDGSREDTREMIENMRKISPVPLLHAWQHDNGFRLAAARNNGILKSTGDYLIFIDGDCFVNKYFVEDHLSLAAKKQFIAGTRVNITKPRQEYIIRTGNRNISFFSWGTRKKFNAIRSRFLSHFYYNKSGMAGANFSLWREDIFRINGFDEWFVGYGGEDADIAIRLENAGIHKIRMVHLGMAYHFAHVHNSCDYWETVIEPRLEEARKTKKFRCELGLEK
ncbi:MAG: glycosyltransferase family 2 protein [Thermoguttaceae bacterium]